MCVYYITGLRLSTLNTRSHVFFKSTLQDRFYYCTSLHLQGRLITYISCPGLGSSLSGPQVGVCAMLSAGGLPFKFYFYFVGTGNLVKCSKRRSNRTRFQKISCWQYRLQIKEQESESTLETSTENLTRQVGPELPQQPGKGRSMPKEQSCPPSGPFLHIHHHFPPPTLRSPLLFSPTFYYFQTPHVSI